MPQCSAHPFVDNSPGKGPHLFSSCLVSAGPPPPLPPPLLFLGTAAVQRMFPQLSPWKPSMEKGPQLVSGP